MGQNLKWYYTGLDQDPTVSMQDPLFDFADAISWGGKETDIEVRFPFNGIFWNRNTKEQYFAFDLKNTDPAKIYSAIEISLALYSSALHYEMFMGIELKTDYGYSPRCDGSVWKSYPNPATFPYDVVGTLPDDFFSAALIMVPQTGPNQEFAAVAHIDGMLTVFPVPTGEIYSIIGAKFYSSLYPITTMAPYIEPTNSFVVHYMQGFIPWRKINAYNYSSATENNYSYLIDKILPGEVIRIWFHFTTDDDPNAFNLNTIMALDVRDIEDMVFDNYWYPVLINGEEDDHCFDRYNAPVTASPDAIGLADFSIAQDDPFIFDFFITVPGIPSPGYNQRLFEKSGMTLRLTNTPTAYTGFFSGDIETAMLAQSVMGFCLEMIPANTSGILTLLVSHVVTAAYLCDGLRHHIAVCRASSGRIYIMIDGKYLTDSSIYSGHMAPNPYAFGMTYDAGGFKVGSGLPGISIEDVRMMLGYCNYTSDFNAPVSEHDKNYVETPDYINGSDALPDYLDPSGRITEGSCILSYIPPASTTTTEGHGV